jgi:two-component system CheB/CheR fusion protein
MARTYAIVSREDWGEVKLRDLLNSELEAFQSKSGRIKMDGPEISFAPPQALALGLVFHELATNAAKYGSLSTARGGIVVTWAIDKGRLVVTWQERGGKTVHQPSQKGFGTGLIERELKSALGARVSFDFDPKGIEIRISIPYDERYVAGSGHRPSNDSQKSPK